MQYYVLINRAYAIDHLQNLANIIIAIKIGELISGLLKTVILAFGVLT